MSTATILSHSKNSKFKNTAGGRGRDTTTITATVAVNGKKRTLSGEGNGPIDAFSKALKKAGVSEYTFLSYEEHALGKGEDARAVAYIQIADENGTAFSESESTLTSPERRSKLW